MLHIVYMLVYNAYATVDVFFIISTNLCTVLFKMDMKLDMCCKSFIEVYAFLFKVHMEMYMVCFTAHETACTFINTEHETG